MGVQTASYMALAAQDTARDFSASIWGQCPVEELRQRIGMGVGAGSGFLFEDDFTEFPDITQGASKILGQNTYSAEQALGRWNVWMGNNSGAAIGTSADTTNLPQEGGVLGITGGTTAIDVTLCAGCAPIRLVSPATGFAFVNKVWFEARVSFSVATSAYGDLFVGLLDPGFSGTHITSAASLVFSATDTIKTTTSMGGCLGFWKRAVTNPGDYAVVYNVNNGTAVIPSSGATAGLAKILTNSAVTGYTTGLVPMTTTNRIPVAQSFVKLGFIFDPMTTCPTRRSTEATTANQTTGNVYPARVRFFLNGQELPWFLNTSDVQASTFPSSFLAPVIGYRSGGTGTGIAYVDWIRCGVLGSY